MNEVAIEALVAAPRDAVYRAWTDPDMMSGWLCEEAQGSAEPGGHLDLAWPSLGQKLRLDVTEADGLGTLELSATIGNTRQVQKLRFESRGESGEQTHIVLRHRAPANVVRGITSGWRLRLFVLEHFLRWGGKRELEVVAGTALGTEQAVFDRLSESARLHIGEPTLHLEPDGLCGRVTDGVIYVIRRFSLSPPSHLLAAQLMTWQDDDLKALRPTMSSLVEQAATPSPSPHLH